MSAPEPALCSVCRVDTAPCSGKRGCRHGGRWEWYMIHNDLWRRIAGVQTRYLCIRCLERRLQRPLTRHDLTDAPINDPSPWDTSRLAAVKARS